MRYMLIMQVEPEAAARAAEELDMEQIVAAMGAYNEELQKAGVFLSAEGLSDAERGIPGRLLVHAAGRHGRTVTPRRARCSPASGSSRSPSREEAELLGAEVPARTRRGARGAAGQRDRRHRICRPTTSGSPRSRSGAPPTRELRPRHAPSHPSGGACSRRRAGARPRG